MADKEEQGSNIEKSLETLTNLVSTVVKNQSELAKRLDVVENISSQTRLKEAKSELEKDDKRQAFLKVFKGKIVTGWKNGVVKYEYSPLDPSKIVGEKVTATYEFIDGKSMQNVDQVDFTRVNDRVILRILSSDKVFFDEEEDKLDVQIIDIVSQDEELIASLTPFIGQELKISKKFLNP